MDNAGRCTKCWLDECACSRVGFTVPIEHLSETCPHCQEGMKAVNISGQHSNGHWNESITYNCGTIATFTPNYYPGPYASRVSDDCKFKQIPCVNQCGAFSNQGQKFCTDSCARKWAERNA